MNRPCISEFCRLGLVAAFVTALSVAPAGQRAAAPPAAPLPVVVIETAKGVIEIELWPADAPKTVAHITALVKRSFYRGLRFHRVTDGLVQIGDPATRDMSRRLSWGSGGSGQPVLVAEIAKRRTHQRGTVGLAHSGAPEDGDSQLYILKRPMPSLDGKHAIIGRVIRGMPVVDRIEWSDQTKDVTLKGAGRSE